MSRGSLKVSVNYLAVPHKPMDATAQTWLKQLSTVSFRQACIDGFQVCTVWLWRVHTLTV